MTQWIRDWILSLTGTALICAAALRLTPEGRVKPVLRLLCGVCMAAALFSPLLGGSLTAAYPLELSRYRTAAAALTEQAESLRQELDRGIIEERMEAYILDKARAMGAKLHGVSVSLRWSTEGFWVPEAATLDGSFCEPLARYLEADLGIPRTAQSWRDDEEP